MSAEYLIPHKHTLKILCNLNIFHGYIKENVSGCFFLNTVQYNVSYLTALVNKSRLLGKRQMSTCQHRGLPVLDRIEQGLTSPPTQYCQCVNA